MTSRGSRRQADVLVTWPRAGTEGPMRDERGAIFAEYVVLLAAVAIGCVIAMVGLGVPLVNLFMYQQGILLLPIP